jgi:hypothetical protein
MNSEFDSSLVFDEQAIDQVRVLRTSAGHYSLRRGIGSPLPKVMETLEQAIVQGSTVLLVNS